MVMHEVRLTQFTNDQGLTNGDTAAGAGAERELAYNVELYGLNTQLAPIGRFDDIAHEVLFDVSPIVTEARAAQYHNAGLPGPVGVVVYKLTDNRNYTISARFVSRSVDEATDNQEKVDLLRSWMIPQSENHRTGVGGDSGEGAAGRPPTLRLQGYKNTFHNIPVVMSSLNITFPDDVDYIATDLHVVPIIQAIEINLIESHALAGILDAFAGTVTDRGAEFSLRDFRQGTLPGYS